MLSACRALRGVCGRKAATEVYSTHWSSAQFEGVECVVKPRHCMSGRLNDSLQYLRESSLRAKQEAFAERIRVHHSRHALQITGSNILYLDDDAKKRILYNCTAKSGLLCNEYWQKQFGGHVVGPRSWADSLSFERAP